jgi:2-oxoisovalerate dehydrogenase E2 component (dihydrolipoyl transacylase)
MARVPFRLPDIGEGIAEAEIVAWHVEIGDMVEEDAVLADLMTDKATVEMTSPVAGRLVERAGEVGDMVAIGSTLAVFESESETEGAVDAEPTMQVAPNEAAQVAAPKPEPALSQSEAIADAAETSSGGNAPTAADANGQREGGTSRTGESASSARPRVLASPAVRARAKDLGVDLATIRPAQGDRVRHADLDAHLRYAGPGKSPGPAAEDVVEEVKVVGLRRRIAENMAEAKRAIPHFAYVEELDVTALEAARGEINAARGDRPKLTLLPFLIRALTVALPGFPMINARYDDAAGVIRRHRAVHLGMATQTEAGLMVPVIRNAQALDLWQLAAEIGRLAEAARSGKAERDELSGSTLTLTSLGPLGGIVSTPVINRPEVAIVGVNRIVERPAVVEGRIEIRKLMNLSSSFDHRVVDGHDAARFIQAVRRLVEAPTLLLAGG